jgi:FixJ family two-component response regulator
MALRGANCTGRRGGLAARCFGSAEQFLNFNLHGKIAWLYDIRIPKMSGRAPQARLKEEECNTPIIFITVHGETPMRI